MSRAWIWPLAALIALLLFNAVSSPEFFAIQVRDGRLFGSLIDILNRGAPVLLLSLGMTLVIATGGVDLSVGAVMAISGAVVASLISQGQGAGVSVVIALAVAVAIGGFNGVVVGWFNVQPIVVTLVLMVAGRGVAQLITDGQIITLTDASFAELGSGAVAGFPMPFVIFLTAWLLIAALTRRTSTGLFVEAVGSSAKASRIAGIEPAKVKLAVYAVSGLMAGVAGLIACADIRAADANNAGLFLELDAILAVCIGGTALTGGRFSLVGSVLGALLMQTLTTTILTRGVSPELTFVAKAILIIAVCLMHSPEIVRKLGRATV
ncbi:MAG: Inner membrane ABC transporter permease protein YtfT [Fimbriimonadaceae bacterium]|nr:Inner membrane ABC transporter permease protein YtfT [Fimbriimonadaceae bacterium]